MKTRLKTAHKDFVDHLFVMPRWHKLVLTLGIVLAGLGIGGQVMGYFGGDAKITVTNSAKTPDGVATVVDGSSTPETVEEVKSESSLQSLSPHATRLGLSVILGFIIGWIFRAFLKVMTFIVLLGGIAFGALSYFGILNVDLSGAKETFTSFTSWLSNQGEALFNMARHHFPSATGGFLGTFLGFRRKIIP